MGRGGERGGGNSGNRKRLGMRVACDYEYGWRDQLGSQKRGGGGGGQGWQSRDGGV